jgi:hypothetical protein
MTAHRFARHYPALTPEERFKLVVAAVDRDDEADRARLVAAAERRTFQMPDYAPFIDAYHDLVFASFPHLLDAAAEFLERYWMGDLSVDDERDAAVNGREASPDKRGSGVEPTARDGAEPGGANGEASNLDPFADERRKRPTRVRQLELAYVAGFILKVQVAGWKLFCERLNVPPFAFFKGLPGFERLERALKLAEKTAFEPADILKWLNRRCRSGAQRATLESIISPESYARQCDEAFREQVKSWGG